MTYSEGSVDCIDNGGLTKTSEITNLVIDQSDSGVLIVTPDYFTTNEINPGASCAYNANLQI